MKKLLAIGEALIDFIPMQKGCGIGGVSAFSPAVGGAPANVCGAYTRLGGPSAIITQLGNDPFGDKIADEFKGFGIGTEYIQRTDEANTCLAFVSLMEDGNREFSFYRKPSADMLLRPDSIRKEWFEDIFGLHFCSVSLGDYPMLDAHRAALKYAGDAGAVISFDPNIRLPLWDDHKKLRERVWEFIPYADVLKISDEELEFITGETDMDKAKEQLFIGRVSLIIYTKGADGAEAYTKNGAFAFAESRKVKAVDTTGAGDAFIGSFLAGLSAMGIKPDALSDIPAGRLAELLEFSNKYCAASVMGKGAIASYPSAAEVGFGSRVDD